MMTRPKGYALLSWRNLALIGGSLAVFAAISPRSPLNAAEATPPRWHEGKYVGAGKCKNCHSKEADGNPYGHWQKMDHAKAFEKLSSPEAIKAGKEKGVESPQQDAKCLKCHVTAFEAPAAVRPAIDPKMGVQCESCHGPGGSHIKARMAAAAAVEDEEESVEYKPVPAGEVILPLAKTCTACHNQESPHFKKFDCAERMEKILHLNPKRKRDQKKVIADLCK